MAQSDENTPGTWLSQESNFSQLLQGTPQGRLLLKDGGYEVWQARSVLDLDTSLQIRYFCYANLPWIRPFNPFASIKSHKSREVPDKYEITASVLLLVYKGTAIGTARLIPESGKFGVPAFECYGCHTVKNILPDHFLLEASRLCVVEEFRKTAAMSHLIAGLFKLAKEHEREHRQVAFVFEAKPGDGTRLYSKLGASSTGMLAMHAVGEMLELMIWPLEHLNPIYKKKWKDIL